MRMNEEFFVEPKRVAKQASGLGEFMMMKCDSGNLLVTGQFILNLSVNQFWSVRCKLEIPNLDVWYMQTKEGLAKSERSPGLEEWEQRYNDWLNGADTSKPLSNTNIQLVGCYLYTDGFTYTAIKQDRIDMLAYSEDLVLSGNMVVVDGCQAITPVVKSVWKNNDWLRRLPGMDTEKESEDEK